MHGLLVCFGSSIDRTLSCRARHWHERARCRSGPEHPSSTVVEAEVDEPAEVDGGHPHRKPELVPGHSAVADPSPAVGHEPGDRSLHHGSVPTVRDGELLGLARVVSRRPSGRGAGWTLSLRPRWSMPCIGRGADSPGTGGRRSRCPVRVIGTMWPCGQVTVPAVVSMVKSSMVNPPGTAERSGMGLMVAWWRASRERGPGLARAVGGVGQDLEARGLPFEQGHPGGAVGRVGRGERRRGDDPGVGLHRDVGLVAVAVGATGTCACGGPRGRPWR